MLDEMIITAPIPPKFLLVCENVDIFEVIKGSLPLWKSEMEKLHLPENAILYRVTPVYSH